jgi:membrane dipeptidase
MIERYPDDLALALSAADIERIAASGKIASLIGIEGGVAIENDLATLRAFFRQGARYMTLTHNETIDWADSATDDPKHGGLSPFGETVVREMNRLGMLVDIAHVAPDTMQDVLRVSKAPVISSHSGAHAVAPHPRNIPDSILRQLPANGGLVMVVFYPGFILPDQARATTEAFHRLRAEFPDRKLFENAFSAWIKAQNFPRATVAHVADHIDHIVQIAGIDHVGLGSDFDGISTTPQGLDSVADFPRLTAELLARRYSEADITKILGGNLLRAFHKAAAVAAELQLATPPALDPVTAPRNAP